MFYILYSSERATVLVRFRFLKGKKKGPDYHTTGLVLN